MARYIYTCSSESAAPRNFNHYVKFSKYEGCDSVLIRLFNEYEHNGNVKFHDGDHRFAIPFTGPVSFGDIEGWIENDDGNADIRLWFKDRHDYRIVVDRVNDEEKNRVKKVPHKIYRADCRGNWVKSDSYVEKSLKNFVGYEHHLQKIQRDINISQKHNEYLRTVGEVKGQNYLLYGPPGTGKTTMAILLASLNEYSIYVMNDISKNFNLMTPKSDETIILLFEDFDRYLMGKTPEDPSGQIISNSGYMSNILNSLDGIDSGSNIIRIFTANDCGVIFSNAALMNRFTACFQIEYPTKDMFLAKLKSLLPNGDEQVQNPELARFVNKVIGKVTLRPFVNYVIRYMFEENFIENLHDNVCDLIIDQDDYMKSAKNRNYVIGGSRGGGRGR